MPREVISQKLRRDHRPKIPCSYSNNGLRFCGEPYFNQILRLEEKRTSRSGKPFLLMLIDVPSHMMTSWGSGVLEDLDRALASSLRETDVRGWYKDQTVIGIIFTEMTKIDEVVREKILFKVHNAVQDSLHLEWDSEIKTSLHLYPEDINLELDRGFDLALYPELKRPKRHGQVSLIFKRLMDVTGSLVAMVMLSPLFLSISLAIKINSKGPILFRQKRLGLHGCQFTLLKFRSMHIDCGEKMHKDYIKQFICEQKSASGPDREGGSEIYKLKDDPRITPVGKFLRKTSLDELPQLLNVLKGEMSLVGPRPPIPYEFEFYDVWHRRRLLEVKPGITGLWQVYGRSCTTFNDMVRIDLRYVEEWSTWLDIKILFKTPWAVLKGKGAY